MNNKRKIPRGYYDAIFYSVEWLNLLKILGITPKRPDKIDQNTKEFIVRCCFHKEAHASLIFSRVKGFFWCFGCGQSGDKFSFVMYKRNYSRKQAVKFFRRHFGITPENYEEHLKKALKEKVKTKHAKTRTISTRNISNEDEDIPF